MYQYLTHVIILSGLASFVYGGYTVQVETGVAFGAGTNANVYIVLYGHIANSGRRTLSSNGDDFESGSKKSYYIGTEDFGVIGKVLVGHDNTGSWPEWLFVQMVVYDDVRKTLALFTCNCWLNSAKLATTLTAPVNGQWAPWSGYGSCSVSCGGGNQLRQRSCDNPPPLNGGHPCSGLSSESQLCNDHTCPVDGGWTDWLPWSGCSVTCGSGTSERHRSCSKPVPQHGGRDCAGGAFQSIPCAEAACPVDGAWSQWSNFGSCNATCGTGVQLRSRACDSPGPSHGGSECKGNDIERQPCNNFSCPVDGGFGDWSNFSPCSASCGGGSMSRARYCDNPEPAFGGENCQGNVSETRVCNNMSCPVNGSWGEWSEFSTCSQTCGNGSKIRLRLCDNPAPSFGGANCSELDKEEEDCFDVECPVNGGFSEWGEFSKCSVTCGNGTMNRQRTCTKPEPAHGGLNCSGHDTETRECIVTSCPIDGSWGEWSEFGSCSQSCGTGSQSRMRSCNNPAPSFGGLNCPGNDTDERECFSGNCPVNGGLSEWSEFSECTATCGNGSRTRLRACSNPEPAYGGHNCSGHLTDIKRCNVAMCPFDGSWGEWSDFGICSQSCGNGSQSRMRSCSNPVPSFGGKNCSGTGIDERGCFPSNCPIAGGFSEWSEFSDCSVTCGDGTRIRSRTCTKPAPAFGGLNCTGHFTELRFCKILGCAIDGSWGEWGPFGRCSQTCGNGSQTRLRLCNNPPPSFGGPICSGNDSEEQDCFAGHCPVDGGFSEWGEFSECSATCGEGKMTRQRTCNKPEPVNGGQNCSGAFTDTRHCSIVSCPTDGSWGEWSDFGTCSQSCGNGSQTRFRSCDNPVPSFGGSNCSGSDTDQQGCVVRNCPVDGGFSEWGEFSRCSVTCGNGTMSRQRHCSKSEFTYDRQNCSGNLTEVVQCSVGKCPTDGSWGEWSDFGSCSQTCGNGSQTRVRSCDNPAPSIGGATCPGSGIDQQGCFLAFCPAVGGFSEWSEFSDCSVTCGDGVMTRDRVCTTLDSGREERNCNGTLTETLQCNMANCPIDGSWSVWSEFGSCSQTCDLGTQTRDRLCNSPAPSLGGADCAGGDIETRGCLLIHCPIDGGLSEWGEFSECSTSCGEGAMSRKRACTNPVPKYGGQDCTGVVTNTQQCELLRCPVDGSWGPWSDFSLCSHTCGAGTQDRVRQCDSPAPSFDGDNCLGLGSEERQCLSSRCPMDGGWSSWGEFSVCSVSCGDGKMTRERSCDNTLSINGGTHCNGPAIEVKACSNVGCDVNGGWGEWSEYSICSESCGNGIQSRIRSCDSPTPVGKGQNCAGEHAEERLCLLPACPEGTTIDSAPVTTVVNDPMLPEFPGIQLYNSLELWQVILIAVAIGGSVVLTCIALTCITVKKKKLKTAFRHIQVSPLRRGSAA